MKKSQIKRKQPLKSKHVFGTAKRGKGTSTVAKHAKLRHPRPKPNRIKTIKRKLWEVFSQYVRQSEADHQGYVTTVDTNERVHWKECDCGHLLANTERSQGLGGNELWYYEDNFAPQSQSGNRFNAGDSGKNYMLYAIKKHGMEEVEWMQTLKKTPRKWTEEELKEKLDYYQGLIAKL